MKSEHQKRVEEFMTKAGQNIPKVPTEPDEKTRILRAKLLIEECIETTYRGLGVSIKNYGKEVEINNLEFNIIAPFDMEEVSDGCADIDVVATGCLSACGIQDEEIILEVDNNNLNKFSSQCKIRDDGKIEKNLNHKPPNILGCLQKQGWKKE